MVESLKKGDKIVTSGGITGTITRVVDNEKVDEIADNATVEVIRGTGVQSLMNSQEVRNNFCLIKVLYFSKLRIIIISFISLFLIFASSNLIKLNDGFLVKINLGLDLQGGSYLLLEIDNAPVIEQKLQNLTITLRNYFKENIQN